MFKRIGVALAAAMLGVVALAGPASSQPEARLTLQIEPKEGKVGTPIDATVPEEYKQECLSGNEFVAQVQTLAGQLIGGQDPSGTIPKLLQSVQTAPSLTPEDLTRLFQPFASTKKGGFGVGAFEAKSLIAAMGGRLTVESRPGEGSLFTITLPAAEAAHETQRKSA